MTVDASVVAQLYNPDYVFARGCVADTGTRTVRITCYITTQDAAVAFPMAVVTAEQYERCVMQALLMAIEYGIPEKWFAGERVDLEHYRSWSAQRVVQKSLELRFLRTTRLGT